MVRHEGMESWFLCKVTAGYKNSVRRFFFGFYLFGDKSGLTLGNHNKKHKCRSISSKREHSIHEWNWYNFLILQSSETTNAVRLSKKVFSWMAKRGYPTGPEHYSKAKAMKKNDFKTRLSVLYVFLHSLVSCHWDKCRNRWSANGRCMTVNLFTEQVGALYSNAMEIFLDVCCCSDREMTFWCHCLKRLS